MEWTLVAVQMLPTCHFSGNYEVMDVSNLPPLWLAYLADPSDSGECAHAGYKGTPFKGTLS